MAENYHYAELVFRQAEKYGNRTALKFRDDATGKWLKVSWREFADSVMMTAKAMAEYGMEVQENIGIYAQNMLQYLYTDFGAHANRMVIVPMYATNSPAQVEYIVNDASIRTLFVGEQLQYNNAWKVFKASETLKRIIIFDSKVKLNPEDKSSIYFDDFLRLGDNSHAESAVRVRINEADVNDIATIIYTSGTTGESKGVILHHYNYLEAMRIHDIRLPEVTDKDLSMCFLPLTHIFEKAWVYYLLHKGVVIAINHDPKLIQKTLPEVRPTLMCNVPRFWEKVYSGLHDKVSSLPKPIQNLFYYGVKVGHAYKFDYIREGRRPPFMLNVKFHIFDFLFFSLVKRVLGIEKGRVFPVAGAPLADNIAKFLISINIPIRYGYGLSETTATVCFYPETGFVLGSIGKVMPDVDVKIDPKNSEILVKGKTVTSGYYKKPEETAKSFTEDGFFRTGDAGRLEGDTLFFTERIKELYKTSNGKYIAPQAIEGLMGGDKYIAQIAVIGDQRKFVSALIVPEFSELEPYARSRGVKFSNRIELVENEDIRHFIMARVEENQKDLALYERIKKITLLAEPFTMENRELTDTLKLRRRVVNERYATQIEAMYEEKQQ
jgi:long-chain acyl-CoA synthetase